MKHLEINDSDKVKKFTRDICNVVGHNIPADTLRCSRCKDLNIEEVVRVHCDQYVGMKINSSTYDLIRSGVSTLLSVLKENKDIIDVRGVTVEQMSLGIRINADIIVPWHPATYYKMSITLE